MSVLPQLVTDLSGINHQDPFNSYSRILLGNSWKKRSCVLVMPAADVIPTKVAFAQWGMVFPPNNKVARILAVGMEVGDAYTSAIEQIITHPETSTWEYLLTIEHDNAPPPDGIVKLMDRMEANPQFACIGGLYFTKGYNGVAQIWGDIKDPIINFRPQPPDPSGGLVECYGTGMGFNLWKLSIFKDARLRKPWFKTIAGTGGAATQDLYFWSDARQYGYRCGIDCSVKVGHYDLQGQFGEPDTMW